MKNNTLRYDFRPSLVDHNEVLILVRPFTDCLDSDYVFALKKLSVFTHAIIEDYNRQLLLRFTKGYARRERLEWGRIQLHRRPLGFVGVASLTLDPTQQSKDYEKITHRFNNLISQYEAHLYDSRCIIIGPKNPEITIDRKDVIYLSTTDPDSPDHGFVNSITEFVSSLFVILESKRVEKLSDNFDRMSLPTAPCEQEQSSSDTDTRAMKRKSLGRNRKLLGDFCLLCGLHREALMYYTHSVDHLRGVNDYLWMGAALEGCCAASNALSMGDVEMRSKPNNRQGSRGLLIKETSIQVNGSPDRLAEDEKLKSFGALSTTELISKYTECLSCYKRFDTGPLLLESHFKFIRALIRVKKKLEICQIVQCLHALPLDFNDVETIDFASVLSSIHEQLGMHRKAAFYRRRVVNCIVRTNPGLQGFGKALTLLQGLCSSYRLKMEQLTATEKKQDAVPTGWSSVQLKILIEMLNISRQLGNKLDSVRLLCFILEKYGTVINPSEHTDLVDLLEEYSDETQKNEVTEKDSNVQLIRPLPIIRDVRAKRLARYLRPLKIKENTAQGPFIFSSLSTRHKKEEEAIVWVCGDVSEVTMMVDNPLPAEIKVNNMTLLTEGVEFEAHPATLALPADSGSFPFMLLGTPVHSGSLQIKGYKVEVLGIANTVLLPTPINVQVTPMMPILKLSSTLPRSPNASSQNPEDKHYQTLFTSANLYRGHSCTGQVTLENASGVPITKLDIKLKKLKEVNVIFSKDYVENQLPLAPGDSINLDVVIMPEDSWKLYNNQDKIETMLTMSYSCEEGNLEGYFREICWVTHVKVMPSLVFSNLELFEVERQPHFCLLCFNVENMTSVSMNVECDVKIDDEEIDWSAFVSSLEKIDMTLESKKKTGLEIKFPRLSLPPPKNKRITIESLYEELISNSVCFSWRLSDTNYSGVTYFQNMKITPDMVPVLKPKHLNIKICVNNGQVNEGDMLCVERQALVNITVALTNSHELDLEDMTLHVNPYQKCHRSDDRMKELCLPSGIMNKGIKKLCPGETFQHKCGLLFLYEGQFMVDISCSANRKFGTPTQKRQRAFAIAENPPTSPVVEKHPWTTPLSPNSVNKKLKFHEADFWAQTFAINVAG